MATVDGREKHGRWLEEFVVGDTILHWPGHTITETENQQYTLLTGNPSGGHLDTLYAQDDGHEAVLVNGVLVLSIVHGLSVLDLSSSPKAIAQLSWDDIKIHVPTYPGDTLYAASRVLDKRRSQSKPDRGIVQVETRGVNQDSKLVISYRRTIMVRRRPDTVSPPAHQSLFGDWIQS